MIVSTDFWHDRRVRKEAKTVLDAGYKLTVIAARRPEDALYKSDKVNEIDSDFNNPNFIFKPVNLTKRKLRNKNIPIIANFDAALWALSGWVRFVRVIWKVKPDLYHCHDIDALALALVPSIWNKSLKVYDCHDIFSEIQVKGSMLDRLRPLWKWLEKVFPKYADGVISATNSLAYALEENSSVPEQKIIRVFNVPYLHKFKPQTKIHTEFNLSPEIKIALYLGSVNLDRGLGALLDCVDDFDENIILAIYGPGHKSTWEKLQLRINKLEHPERVYLGSFIPLKDVHNYIMSSDISLIPNILLSSAYDALPNKFFEGLMAGRALVTNKLPEMSAIIEKTKCGIVCDNRNPNSYVNAINQLMSDEALRMKMGEAGRMAAENNYNWSIESKKILSLYRKLLNNND